MIVIDQTSYVPAYEQIRSQFAAQISDGTLPAGSRLPTVRRLASDLGLAVNTAARAYRELEAAGLVVTRGRGGTTVTPSTDTSLQRLQAAAAAFAATARHAGLDKDQALSHVTAALLADRQTRRARNNRQ